MANVIDFSFDSTAMLPTPPEQVGASEHDATIISTAAKQGAAPVDAAPLGMDFDLGDAPPAATPGAEAATALEADFNLDLGVADVAPMVPDLKLDDLSLNLDEPPAVEVASESPAEGGVKDDRWYDVQTKFDLAKAYQEMGDKDGAREILQEVLKEGDAAQQAEAKQLLDSLD